VQVLHEENTMRGDEQQGGPVSLVASVKGCLAAGRPRHVAHPVSVAAPTPTASRGED